MPDLRAGHSLLLTYIGRMIYAALLAAGTANTA